jgi:hypothetical protein
MVCLETDALPDLESFAREMEQRQEQAGGLMRSAYGKARGTALRLALVLEYLWWCARPGEEAPPAHISQRAFAAATQFVADYLMPIAERVYGDAAASERERNAATLARWIVRVRPKEVHVRHLQRGVRLPGLREAGVIKAACDALIEAGWPPPPIGFGAARKVAYPVNARVLELCA